MILRNRLLGIDDGSEVSTHLRPRMSNVLGTKSRTYVRKSNETASEIRDTNLDGTKIVLLYTQT